jgi:hypothetical protein
VQPEGLGELIKKSFTSQILQYSNENCTHEEISMTKAGFLPKDAYQVRHILQDGLWGMERQTYGHRDGFSMARFAPVPEALL